MESKYFYDLWFHANFWEKSKEPRVKKERQAGAVLRQAQAQAGLSINMMMVTEEKIIINIHINYHELHVTTFPPLSGSLSTTPHPEI